MEVTETALILRRHQIYANLNKLRQDSFRIALDDFGSGSLSVGYLASVRVDIIKFDFPMARHLEAGYHTVAERVETESALQKILRIGFEREQGYLFGRPGRMRREAAQFYF
jgi:EAL domain-containing protein (putative c-di-GMP-specific phosphodiesterase class I)